MVVSTSPDRAVIHIEPEVLVERVGRTVVMMVRGGLTVPSLQAMQHEVSALGRTGPVSTVSVVGPEAALPPADVRAAAERATRSAPATLACAANVLLAEGFFGAAVRSLLTAIESTAGRGQRRRTFGTLGDALRWVSSEAALSSRDAARLHDAVLDMGRGFDVPVR